MRDASSDDVDLLCRLLAMAADWRPGTTSRSVAAVLADPALAHYVLGWPADGERGLVAEAADGHPVGAAWWRFLPPDDPGYGYVRADVPEISLAVVEASRGRGVGRSLLTELATLARRQGVPALSLSVEPDNPAVRLYRQVGFEEVGSTGGAVTMLLGIDRFS